MLERNYQEVPKQEALGDHQTVVKYPRNRGVKNTGGEIIQVHGGHIVRSINRKDRHSKVYTAKGHRDRRVRLAAHTAIEFYDIQDRLGYDRPSKAVDWLIEKAKSAIDKLDVLPPWQPNVGPVEVETNDNEMAIGEQSVDGNVYNLRNYSSDVLRSVNPIEDLDLSLHSFPGPGGPGDLVHGQSVSLGFDANFDRMVSWNNHTSTENRGGTGGGGFQFHSIHDQSSPFSHREPLQSSFTNYVRAWSDIPITEHKTQDVHHSSIFGSRFVSDGLPGFCIPARIHGEDEHMPS
ncbi:hypothetical protein ACFE04_030152 [Oxalis oulophora]